MSDLRITEIFLSLQGEANTVGRPTVFVRLTGCPLRCQYCDSEYAFSGGTMMNLDDITQQVQDLGVAYVTVTGGETLGSAQCHSVDAAPDRFRTFVSLETSGALVWRKCQPQ